MRIFLGACALVLVAFSAAFAAEGPRARAIVLVSIDDLRADEASGATFDRLRREAVEFSYAETAATWTLPSHASILTGLYPAAHGAGMKGESPLPASVPFVPSLLRRRGYRTAAFVQAGYLDAAFGFDRGFEVSRCDARGMRVKRDSVLKRTFPDALDWLSAHRSERIFLFVHTNAVHMYMRLPDTLARSGPFQCPLPIDFEKAYPEPPPFSSTEAGCRQARYNYRNAVACLDAPLDAFLREVDRRLPRERTLVIVTADHGESLCDEGDAGHRFHGGAPRPELERVPLFVRFPGGAGKGTRVDEAVSLVDLAPTILAAAGAAPPIPLPGRALSPSIDKKGRVLFADGEGWSSASRGGLRLTRFADGRLESEGDARGLEAELDAHAKESAGLREAFGVAASSAQVSAQLREALRFAGYLTP